MCRALATRRWRVEENKRIQPKQVKITKQCVKQNQRKDWSFPIQCMVM